MGDIAEDITKKDLLWHLQGNWAPIDKELSELNLEVKGEIPNELNGLFLRNGMNPKSGHSVIIGSSAMVCFTVSI